MIEIEYCQPFKTTLEGDFIRLHFIYGSFTIKVDNETFHFIPLEGKDILIHRHSKHIHNISTVFVFQKGNRFTRLPLYQLGLVTNMMEHLTRMFNEALSSITLGDMVKGRTGFSDPIPVPINKPNKELLLKELDYELASLHEAMGKEDATEKARALKRLTEIHALLYPKEQEV